MKIELDLDGLHVDKVYEGPDGYTVYFEKNGDYGHPVELHIRNHQLQEINNQIAEIQENKRSLGSDS